MVMRVEKASHTETMLCVTRAYWAPETFVADGRILEPARVVTLLLKAEEAQLVSGSQ